MGKITTGNSCFVCFLIRELKFRRQDTTKGSSRQFQYLVMLENCISLGFAREIVFSVRVWWIPAIPSNILCVLENKFLRIVNIIYEKEVKSQFLIQFIKPVSSTLKHL